jgi:DNA replication protein DnaC
MTKKCRCGKEYEAGYEIAPLPCCPDCADKWDAEIDAKFKSSVEPEEPESDRLDSLGIRPRHYGCTFQSFIVQDDSGARSLEVCKRMAETKRGIIAMIGNNGTGKTHLACATVREIGVGRIYKMIEVGMFIREAFKPNSTKTEQEQLDALIKLSFLGIDEVEKSKRTENEIVWLSYLIDERNERNRPTMIIGNCHPRTFHKDGQSCDKCFESIMTPDILDRISQSGVIRYMDGESYRSKLRGKE